MRPYLATVIVAALLVASCMVTSERETGQSQVPRQDEEYLVTQVNENPEDPVAFESLGFYYWVHQRDPYQARSYLEKAVKLFGRKRHTAPHYYLGCVCWELRDFDSAIRELQDCVEVPPKNPAVLLNDKFYGLAHHRLSQIYAEERVEMKTAEVHLQKFLELTPQTDLVRDLHGILARAYAEKAKDAKKAREHLEKFRYLQGDETFARRIERAIEALEGK